MPGQTVYCAAKAAVKLLSEGLAGELSGTSVHVTVVSPGAVATAITANSGLSAPAAATGHKSSLRTLSAGTAAEIIVRGIERNAYHLFVGRDAALMDTFVRISPARAARAIAKKMGALLP